MSEIKVHKACKVLTCAHLPLPPPLRMCTVDELIYQRMRLRLAAGLTHASHACPGAAAALGQALIPYYTGVIIDLASIDPDPDSFQWTCAKLVAVSPGLRGVHGHTGRPVHGRHDAAECPHPHRAL